MVLLNVAGTDFLCKKKKRGGNINGRFSPLPMNNPIDVPLNSQRTRARKFRLLHIYIINSSIILLRNNRAQFL